MAGVDACYARPSPGARAPNEVWIFFFIPWQVRAFVLIVIRAPLTPRSVALPFLRGTGQRSRDRPPGPPPFRQSPHSPPSHQSREGGGRAVFPKALRPYSAPSQYFREMGPSPGTPGCGAPISSGPASRRVPTVSAPTPSPLSSLQPHAPGLLAERGQLDKGG